MLQFIKEVFTVLLILWKSLSCMAKASGSTKCISLNNKPCLDRPIYFHLNSNELIYYPFMVSLD